MKAKPTKQSSTLSSKAELLTEIAELREQLAAAHNLLEFRDYRRRELSKMLNLGIWEWDEITNQPISFSDELADVFGIDPTNLGNCLANPEEFLQIVHPEDRQHYLANLPVLANMDPGVCHVFDYRVISDKRETRYLREFEQGVFSEQGELISSFGMVQDVTSAVVAVEALTDSEQRFSSLFAQMPLGVQEEDYTAVKKVIEKLIFQGVEDLEEYFRANPRILRDLVGQTRITQVNDALLRIHHADSKEEFLAEESDVDLWWDVQWADYYASEFAGLARDCYFECERVDFRLDGSLFETRSMVRVLNGYEDNWERVITIHEDISVRKRGEAALLEAKNQAEHANEAKSQFLSRMSHELRTPLNAILGFSQLFTYDTSLSEQHLANATEINRAGKHLMSLIEQILDLSRIEAGETEIVMLPVSMPAILNDSVNWVAPLALNRGISIDFDEAEFENILVQADATRLKQVFLNLLTNAIKYNHEGGKISILCEPQDGGRLRIGIRDNGVGIHGEDLDELFQPFNRLGAEFSGVEGTGIGLVITRQLTDLMQGELNVDSKHGEGSTFWVTLRLANREDELQEALLVDLDLTDVKPSTEASVSKILVAEDNPINQELLVAQLNMLGYQADYVDNGVQALQRWERGGYDMLLTDIRMPEMNGYELITRIRQQETSLQHRTPVIAITANAMQLDVEKCFEVGVDDVIAKPVELEDLRNALQKWVPDKLIDFGLSADDQPSNTDVADSIDLSVLMQSTGNKPELHQHLLESYRAALEDDLSNILQAFAWKNSEQLADSMHRLKSSSRSLGALSMAEVCQQIESLAIYKAWDQIEELMPRLQQCCAEANLFIEGFVQESELTGQTDALTSPPHFELEMPEEDDITHFSIKLLLIDDDYIMHRVTTVMLNDLGISGVLNATSGLEALTVLERDPTDIDVIICDLNMPEMDGVEFIRRLAQRNFGGSLILTSGEDLRILKTVEKLAMEHRLQVLGILEKPITPAKLVELLDSLDQIRQEGTLLMTDAFSLKELREAISNDELDTYFQPKVDIASGKVVGIEALARWEHPDQGLIRPDAFITMAEEHGLIGELTENVCRRALDYAARLKAMGFNPNVAINLSVDSLVDLTWPDRISGLLEQYGLDPSSISFEVTESRLMEDLSVALDILSRLSLKRFNLSIDDFGTGYSSMEQLQRIPFTEFKIDRAFVHGATHESSARAILESSVLLAQKLNMTVVAEGVEDQQDWDIVAELGCDQVQGYFVSRPLPFNQLLAWLRQR